MGFAKREKNGHDRKRNERQRRPATSVHDGLLRGNVSGLNSNPIGWFLCGSHNPGMSQAPKSSTRDEFPALFL